MIHYTKDANSDDSRQNQIKLNFSTNKSVPLILQAEIAECGFIGWTLRINRNQSILQSPGFSISVRVCPFGVS